MAIARPLSLQYVLSLAEEPLRCSTGGDGCVDEELGEDLVAHKSTVAQVFFLRRTFQPSTHQSNV